MRRLEEKWRAMPPERELQVRMEILVEEQRGLDESRERRNGAKVGGKVYRLADRNSQHFFERTLRTRRRITVLRAEISAEASTMIEESIDDARARKLRKLRQNSEAMLGRFLVVTPGHNETFLAKLDAGSEYFDGIDVDAVLRAENIRLVSLDNPERWTSEGRNVVPQKFLALHPSDIVPALRALDKARENASSSVDEAERAERATIVWLPENAKRFRHPDLARTVYPPDIDRLALDCRDRSSHPGWAVLRAWGSSALESYSDPINGCKVDFDFIFGKSRYHALLDPDDLEEILL